MFDSQFLQRQKILGIYREMLRTIRQVPEEGDRKYLRDWARDEFKRNKSVMNQVTGSATSTYSCKESRQENDNIEVFQVFILKVLTHTFVTYHNFFSLTISLGEKLLDRKIKPHLKKIKMELLNR